MFKALLNTLVLILLFHQIALSNITTVKSPQNDFAVSCPASSNPVSSIIQKALGFLGKDFKHLGVADDKDDKDNDITNFHRTVLENYHSTINVNIKLFYPTSTIRIYLLNQALLL